MTSNKSLQLWNDLTETQAEAVNGGRRKKSNYTRPSFSVAVSNNYAFASGKGAFAVATGFAEASVS